MSDVRSDKDLSPGSPTVTSVAPYIAAGLGHLAAAGNPFDRDFPASSPSPNMGTKRPRALTLSFAIAGVGINQ